MTNLQIQIGSRQEKAEYGKKIGMAVLFMTGWAEIYGKAFSSLASGWWLLALAGGLCCMILLLFCESKWQSGVILVGLGIGFWLCKDGVLCLVNEVLDFLTKKTGRIYLNYPVNKEAYVYVAGVGMMLLLAVWTAKAIRYREKVTLLLLWLITLGSTVSGFANTGVGFVLVCMATAVFFWQEGIWNRKIVIPIICLSVLCCVACLSSGLISQKLSVQKTKESLKQKVHQWRYESNEQAMPEGNVSNLGAFEKASKPMLEVKMEKPQKMYLRGMTGEIYTGTKWSELEEAVYLEAEDIFYWLHKTGFYGQNSIGNAILVTQENSKQKMQITNVGACKKYQYIPYAMVGEAVLDADVIGDGSVSPRKMEIELDYLAGSLPEWYQGKINLINSEREEKTEAYLKQEKTYRNFVYEQDLQITNSVVGVCERLLDIEQDAGTLQEITTIIRKTLEDELTYSENVVTFNGENDFFQYTLEQSKEGYSVHYATAATLMLRYCGVPARYVEGYYISEEMANRKAGECIQLTDANAHAWAEYYLDGIGWIPFEVTPGYVDEEENMAVYDLLAKKNSTQKQKQTYTKSDMNYQPALEQEQKDTFKEKKQSFFWNRTVVFNIVFLLVIMLLTMAGVRIVFRRKRLYQTFQKIRQADNRNAIAMYYKYAGTLRAYADGEIISASEEIEQLNKEALFSNHHMTKEQRRMMGNYAKEVVKECKASWWFGKRFWYHYVLWLYR